MEKASEALPPADAPEWPRTGSTLQRALGCVVALVRWLWLWLVCAWRREVGHVCVERSTGRVHREKMFLGKAIARRLLFSPPVEALDRTAWLRHLLGSEAIHEGHAMNKPDSAKDIPGFVRFFGIDMTEFKRSRPEEYRTFNDFFTRELKPGARPIAAKADPTVAVSAADCRLVVFDTVQEARSLWIKGERFSLARMVGDERLQQAFSGGALASFRLSPQDYHHYHSPVDGVVEWWHELHGTYYAVDPFVIRSGLDVLGENARSLLLLHSPQFGRVLFIAIGAATVGSVKLLPRVMQAGHRLHKGDEIGLFKYGGSNVVVVFEPGRIAWDEDLRRVTLRGWEMHVRVGQSIGRATEPHEE